MNVSVPVEIKPERLKQLMKNLVDIYSPSGKEDEILLFTETYLLDAGLPVIRQSVDDDRYNLIVIPGKVDEVRLCFVGHLDTVTAYDLEEFGFRENGDNISGLGAADMKSGCAAMIEAFTVLAGWLEQFPPVALALVVSEEEDNAGAEALVKEYFFPWAIIGEPTHLSPCLGHYTYQEVMIRTEGKKAHSSMPEFGKNAIEAMLRLLLGLMEYTSAMPHGLVSNIRELSGYPGGFVVPDVCEAWLDLHLPPDSDMSAIREDISGFIRNTAQNNPDVILEIEFEDEYPGYRISGEGKIVEYLKDIITTMSLDVDWHDFRSHSDGNILKAAGINPVILGPGGLEEAHTPEESVVFSEVLKAAQIYLSLARMM